MKQLTTGIIIVLSLMSGKAFAQADISMATHWYNRANYNPASIARTDYLYLFSNVRQQWVGVNGAPKVFNIQASEYMHNLHSAFGISLVGETIGVTQAFNPMLSYAYRIANNKTWALSMGLSAGMFMRTVNGSLFEAETIIDPTVQYTTEKVIRPDIHAGIEFQCTHYIFGFSSTHLLAIGKPDDLFLNTNHRYGYAIYKNTDPELFNYNIGFQVVNRYNLTVLEFNTIFRFKNQTGLIKGPHEIFDLGLTYRTSRQLTLLFGINLMPNARIGYAFDQSFISGYSRNGTHEIMLEYRILYKAASTRVQCGNTKYWYH